MFKTAREKRLWIFAFAVLAAIMATLFLGRPLQEALRDQNVQAVFFLAGLILTVAAVLVQGFKTKPGKTEIAIWLGLAAVYVMFIFRLGAPERSHVIEYSVLAIFIHEALRERHQNPEKTLKTAFIAFFITSLIGVLDECLQWLSPHRVLDPVDMFFNSQAALMAIGATVILRWARQKFGRQTSQDEG